MENQIVLPQSLSCVDESYRLIDEIKHIIINLKRSKKIFDQIVHSSSETVRALHYVKNEIEFYVQQYEDVFNKYKTSLENIKEFAKEIASIEKSYYLFYPYRHVKEKYDKLLKEHENCEKRLNPILIKVIMNKQESQHEDFKQIQEILKSIPNYNKNEYINNIEKIIQNLVEKSSLEISVPRIDSALLFDPPTPGDSKLNLENDPDRRPEWDQDDCVQTKHSIKKIYKRGVEVACEPVNAFSQNMSILSELKRFDESRNILKFYGLSRVDDDEMLVFEWASLGSLKNVYENEKKKIPWDLKVKIAQDICQGLLFLSHANIFHRDVRCENIMMTHYMEPKITNFYLAKHASEIGPDNEEHIADYILRIINWYAPEMMQKNAKYTQECEVFVMLLWELAFQRIPYEKMSKEEIIFHVQHGRRESPDPPFYTLEYLNIQRKYLKIIADGWDNNPERRIRMDDILLRFSDIENDLTKPKRNNSSSVHSSDQLDQLSPIRTRAASTPVKPHPHFKKQRPQTLRLNESKPDKHTIPDTPGFYPSPRISYQKDPRKSRPMSLILKTPTLEPVNELYHPYLTETPGEIDSFETYQLGRPNKYDPSMMVNSSPPGSPIISITQDYNSPKTDVIEESYSPNDEAPNKARDIVIEESSETLDLVSSNEEADDDDQIPPNSGRIKSPSSQASQNVPISISKKLNHGLIINAKKMQIATPLACASTSEPKMKVLDIIKFQAKLIPSSKPRNSFLLENHITGDLDNLDWISNADPLINTSKANSVYLEIKFSKAEITFEKGSIKPSKEFDAAIKNSLNHNNPYRELIKVFEEFGHFLPNKVILGDKLYSISKSSTTQKSAGLKSINKEFKKADDFSRDCRDYIDIMKQWQTCIKSNSNVDSSSLTSIGGNSIKKDKIKEWAISCLTKSPDSWNIINWEDLYPLYEILEPQVCQDVKLCLGIDEQTISTGVKEKVLRSGVIQIDSSKYKYPVKFDIPLESNNYQIFGKVSKQDGTPVDNVDVKFKSKDKSGFLATVETFSENNLDDLQITWVLVGIPSDVGIFDSNTRSISVLCINKRQFSPKPAKDDTGIDNCDVQLKTPDSLPSNAILITSFKYPKSDHKQSFIAEVKDYRDKTIHVNISVKKSESLDDDDDDFVETPELCWSVLQFDDEDETNNLKDIGQNVFVNSNSNSNEIDVSYKKLDSETINELVEFIKVKEKSISKLDVSYNNINSKLGNVLMKALESHSTLTCLNLRATYIESDTLLLLLKMIKYNKTHINDLDLSHNGEKLVKKGKMFMEALGKNTTILSLNLSENPFDWSDVGDLSFNNLQCNKTLENLDLSNCNLSPKVVEKLKKFLITSKKLKSLNLSSNNLAYQSERIISEVLTKNKSLKILNLSSNKISSSIESLDKDTKTSLSGRYKYKYDMSRALKVNNLAEAIRKNKTLKKLDLSSNYIRLEAGRNIARALTNNKFITELNFSDNDIVHELSEFLITILLNNNITGISLRSTKISSEMVTTLAQDLKSNKIKLRYLNLSRNEISSDAIGTLIEALEDNKTLKNLDLSDITGAGQIGQELTKSLEKNKTLKTLNLSNCNIRNNVVNALEKALRTNNSLSDLDLSYNSCPMSNLLKALEKNRSLIKLNISNLDLLPEEIEALSDALTTNNTLTHLCLSKTMDDPDTGKALFKALEVNTRLIDLDLSKNNIQDIELISNTLLNNGSLRRVDLTS
ncbi:26490_t:CDS:2, partial [Gigaspora margarita]